MGAGIGPRAQRAESLPALRDARADTPRSWWQPHHVAPLAMKHGPSARPLLAASGVRVLDPLCHFEGSGLAAGGDDGGGDHE